MTAREFSGQCGTRQIGVVLHPSSKHAGHWQVTRFDDDGFSGDSQFASREAAERDIDRDGLVPSSGLLERLAATERFRVGTERTYVVEMINDLSFRRLRGNYHGEICMAYNAGGLPAARTVYRSYLQGASHGPASLPQRCPAIAGHGT